MYLEKWKESIISDLQHLYVCFIIKNYPQGFDRFA